MFYKIKIILFIVLYSVEHFFFKTLFILKYVFLWIDKNICLQVINNSFKYNFHTKEIFE